MVIKDLLTKASNNLKGLEYCDEDKEAMFILAKLLDKDISYLYLNLDKEIDSALVKEYEDIINLRKTGYPFHYIFKEKDFYDLNLYIEPGVLIPRYETEILVEYVLDYVKENALESLNIVEVGSGSGAIGLTIAKHLPHSNITCLDISDTAIKVGNINKQKLNLKNINFIKSDIFSKLDEKYKNSTDIIISNPPYIETNTLNDLQKDVINFEPSLALDGGEDGLYFYRKITKLTNNYLKENGILVYEIGYNQGMSVKEILKENKFRNIKILKDYQNHDRVVTGEKI